MKKVVTRRLNTLTDALTSEIASIYEAEHQLIERLPKIAQEIASVPVRTAIHEHLIETRVQVDRLERIFSLLGINPLSGVCEGMMGILRDADSLSMIPGDSLVKDEILIGALQRVEHYEIAAYVTARTLAEQLDLNDVADLLQESLEEEAITHRRLTRISEDRGARDTHDREKYDSGGSRLAQ